MFARSLLLKCQVVAIAEGWTRLLKDRIEGIESVNIEWNVAHNRVDSFASSCFV